mgnify:CR=1 FL=1
MLTVWCVHVRGSRSTITISYSYPGVDFITGAVLVAPCACTHSLNMNQRVIFLEVRLVCSRVR